MDPKTNIGKAMVFVAVDTPFSAQEFPLPGLGPGEILVKNLYCTICASDLHSFYGKRPSCTHSVLGHEIVGEIQAFGPDTPQMDYRGLPLQVGDLVTWTVFAFDAESVNARKGFPQKSSNLYKYGHERISSSHQFNGGFATHTHLLKGTVVFRLPQGLPLQTSAPINCCHATIAGAMRLAGNLVRKKILVNGSGMLGLSACAQAKHLGASEVWAQDINPLRLQKAKAFGADQIRLLKEERLEKTQEKVDVIIETSGRPEAIEACISLLDIGGIMILVGSVYPQRDFAVNAETLVRNLLSIKGVHNYIPEDLGDAIDFIEKTQANYPFELLVGEEYPLHALDRAFEAGKRGHHFRIGIYL